MNRLTECTTAPEVVQTPSWQAENRLKPCSHLEDRFLGSWAQEALGL